MLSNVTQNTYCAVSNNHPCLGLGLIISPRPEAWRLLLDVSFNVSKVRNGKPFKIVDSRVNMSDLVNFLGNVNLARFRDLISRLQVHERTTYLPRRPTCTINLHFSGCVKTREHEFKYKPSSMYGSVLHIFIATVAPPLGATV